MYGAKVREKPHQRQIIHFVIGWRTNLFPVWSGIGHTDYKLSWYINNKLGSDSILRYCYRKSYCGDKTAVRLSYLHNGISYTGKTASWTNPLKSSTLHHFIFPTRKNLLKTSNNRKWLCICYWKQELPVPNYIYILINKFVFNVQL